MKAMEAERGQEELWGNHRRLLKKMPSELGPLGQEHSFLTKRLYKSAGAGRVSGCPQYLDDIWHEARLVRKQ